MKKLLLLFLFISTIGWSQTTISEGILKATVLGTEKIPVSGSGHPVINANRLHTYHKARFDSLYGGLLTNGQGTTASGTAINLGGIITATPFINITGSGSLNIAAAGGSGLFIANHPVDNKSNASIRGYNSTLSQSAFLNFDLDNLFSNGAGVNFVDQRSIKKGIEYVGFSSDYSGLSTTSLVPKEYVDAKVADAINDGVTTIAPSENAVFDALVLKQATLVSAINIKTVNSNSLLGSGNISVGDALVANPLSQFASTSSAQLRSILNDEVGGGAAYFIGGALGTPASGTATNFTGLPLSTGITGFGTGWLSPLAASLGSGWAAALNATYSAGGGGSWSSILPARNSQSGTTYTLVLADKDKYLEFTNASPVTVTIPTNASVAFATDTEIAIYQNGTGLVTVAVAGGVIINAPAGVLTSPGQYAVMILKQRAVDNWYLENGTPLTTRTDVWLNNGATALTANSSQTGAFKNTFSLDGIEITQNARSSAWLSALKVTPAANTVMTASSNTFFNFYMPTYSQEFLSGNMTDKYFNLIDAPTATISGSVSTYTNIFNWYFKNPVAGSGFTGTNNVWSLGAENAKFNGNILGTGTLNLTGSATSLTITNTTANAGIFSITPQSANGGVILANSSATAFPGNWIETSQPFYVGAAAGGTASSPNDLFRINGNAASSNFADMSINSITASKSAALGFTQGSGAGTAGNRNMFLGIDGNATDNYYGLGGSSNNFLFRFWNGAAFQTAMTVYTGTGNIGVQSLTTQTTSTATAAGTTTLTASSSGIQIFTGVTTQTVVVPVVTTMNNGFSFRIVNVSSGVVTVQTSGSNSIKAMAANSTLDLWVKDTTAGTGTASWIWYYNSTLNN